MVFLLRQNGIESKEELRSKFLGDKHFLEKELKLWIKAKNTITKVNKLPRCKRVPNRLGNKAAS